MALRRSSRNKNWGNEIKVELDNSKKNVEQIQDNHHEPPKKKSKISAKKLNPLEEDTTLEDSQWVKAKSIYDFKATDINGSEVSLAKYVGKVCIIVNVASRCGHTKSNYEQFVEIFDKYSEEKGLVILAFPCNQFGNQEPGDSTKICEFVKKRNVKFDVFQKIEVNGKNAHPLWKYLTSNLKGPKGNKVDWNFTKFIVNKQGQVVERLKSSVKPNQMVEILKKYWYNNMVTKWNFINTR